MTKNWSKKSPHDYENQKGKTYRSDRITDTAKIMKKARRDKYPAPNLYKIKDKKFVGVVNYEIPQLHEMANA